jgi:hypothetical protein
MSQPNFIYSIMHQGTIDAITSIRPLTNFASLGELQGHGEANFGSGWLYGNDQVSFAPQAGVQVDTLVHLTGAGVFSGLVHSFQVIPEPGGTVAWLALAALVGFRGIRPDCNRSSRS